MTNLKLTQMQEALKLLTRHGFKQHDTFKTTGAFQLEVRSYIHKTEMELLQAKLGFKSWEISLDESCGIRSQKNGSFFVRFDW